MKFIKHRCISLLTLSIMLISVQTVHSAEKVFYKTGDTLHVLSDAGLVLRKDSDKNSAKLALVPYGKQLTVTDNDAGTKPFEVNGVKGYWVKASYQGKEGYAFDGFLSRHPAPDKSSGESSDFNRIDNYADKKLKPAGKPVPTPDDNFEIVKKKYTNGFAFDRKEGKMGLPMFSVTLIMPDTRIYEAFFLMKQMGFATLRGRAVPVSDSKGQIKMKNAVYKDIVEIKKTGSSITLIRITDTMIDELSGEAGEVESMEFTADDKGTVVTYQAGGN